MQMPLRVRRWLGVLVAVQVCAAVVPAVAVAEVTRFEVKSRATVGTSGYEKIVGTAYFAVDPKAPRNSVVADIDRAPVNAGGRVEFSADVYILRPLDAAASNGVVLADVLNRGRKMVLNSFNRGGASDPTRDADLGDGFLMKQGFTVVWVGWEFDVRRASTPEEADRGAGMAIAVPAAQGVSELIRAIFIPDDEGTQTVGDLAGYRPQSAAAADITLTVRDGQFDRPEPVARGRYTVDGNRITLTGGFEKGRLYEIAYRPESWPISGLGLAAYRDFTSWIKYNPASPARVSKAIAFGSSQSGRFLRTLLYYGFNADEQERQVLDGAMIHIAGAARLSINERGAQPTALSMYSATQFPFATTAERDPLTGRTEGLLENPRARAHQPKIFFTNTSVEYWGGGRSAALVHTSPDGSRDLTLADNVRAYFLTGSQHGPARFPTKVSRGQQPDNPLEYQWTLRALLVSMTKWVKDGAAPPASQVPRLADGTLTKASAIAFPKIPGVQSPTIIQAARYGEREMPFLVPQVDADGNELAGVRTAEQRVPMATYTGWNFRNASIGGTKQLVSLLGTAVPFPLTDAAAAAAHDPRRSVAARYPTRDTYSAAVAAACEALVKGGYLLSDDVSLVLTRLDAQWAHTHP